MSYFHGDKLGKVIFEEYLDFIREMPCVACGRKGPSDPDHIQARGTGSHKQVDFFALPMCRKCHTERGQLGNEKFMAKHGIENLWREVARNMVKFLTQGAQI